MRRTAILFEYLDKERPRKVLDIGNLAHGAVIHKRIIGSAPKEAEIWGLDITSQDSLGFKFENQVIGSIEEAPLEDSTFDFIYMGEVLEHVWNPKKVIDECYRLLSAGGILVIDTPNIYALHRMIRYLFKGRDYILGEPDHKIFFSYAMLENLFKEAGFEIEVLTSDRKFTLKGMRFVLPNFGSFKTMGSHLIVVGRK